MFVFRLFDVQVQEQLRKSVSAQTFLTARDSLFVDRVFVYKTEPN